MTLIELMGQKSSEQTAEEHQRNMNQLDMEGNSPLHNAISSDEVDCARKMIDHGANLSLVIIINVDKLRI